MNDLLLKKILDMPQTGGAWQGRGTLMVESGGARRDRSLEASLEALGEACWDELAEGPERLCRRPRKWPSSPALLPNTTGMSECV